jgi:hypothetical protein
MKEYTFPCLADKNKLKVQFKPNSNKSLCFIYLKNLGGLESWNPCKVNNKVKCPVFTLMFNIINHMNDDSDLIFFRITEPSGISSIGTVHYIE